jgi:hypothetical protein
MNKLSDKMIFMTHSKSTEFTTLLLDKYFSNHSPIKLYLEELMVVKGLQGFMREFSEDMTFRDFNKIKGEINNDDEGNL